MPTGLLTAAVIGGVGLSAFGTISGMNASSDANNYQKQMISEQQALEAQRHKQMELEAKRQQLETLRNSQRARAVAVASATSQGAQFGSGLQGGLAQITGQEDTQLLAGNQNLAIGDAMFGINQQLSASRIGYADAQSRVQTASALTSLGGQLVNSAGAISRVGGSLTGPGSFQSGTNPFNYDGSRNSYYS